MRTFFTLCFIALNLIGNCQKDLKTLLEKHNKGDIPYISVQELAMPKTEAVILDARETTEFETSHIEDAIHVGYNAFDLDIVKENVPDKTSKIVVYCSLGIRSEHIAERLKNEGYTNIFNLFGGIFEWKNNDFVVYDQNNEPTENVHAFSKEWSKWLLKGNKIYD
ncbi:MAG: rhodanese-like domain-containing protein [Winogradskyella sp.]|jgi:rhodanese-related sulfurtransferase